MQTGDNRRRSLLRATLGVGLSLPFLKVARAAVEDPTKVRPRAGDRFVYAMGKQKGDLIGPEDLPLGGPQKIAYPMDPVTEVLRNGTRLNQVALVRLDPDTLTAETRAAAANGVVAYSAVCPHQGCPISMWKRSAKHLYCACHGSEFDPRDMAEVKSGPAPHRLANLPLKNNDGVLMAAGEFVGRVGSQIS